MAFLARVAAALLLVAGCYSPDLRDCTVSCASSADCAGAQVCRSDHVCAATGATCATSSMPHDAALGGDANGDPLLDAAVPVDARMPPEDAPPPPIDAPPLTVDLHLHVDGHGALAFIAGSCSMDCHYQVFAGVPVQIYAIAGTDQRLDRWTQGPCAGAHSTSCTVTPTAPLTVAARFKKDDN